MTLRALYGLPAPTRLSTSHTALVLVDFQEEFFQGALPLPGGARAASAAARLLEWARARGLTVVHVKNVVTKPNSPLFASGTAGVAIISALSPTAAEHVVVKASGGGFTHSDLHTFLQTKGIDTLVIAGLMTHLAVYMTATDGAGLGYHVIVAAGAAASRDLPSTDGGAVIPSEVVHRVALAALADRFADVLVVPAIRALPVGP